MNIISNKRLGNIFENDFAKYLSSIGYWVAPFPGKSHTNSQPCDIVACKNNKTFLIDCKVLSNKTGRFPLSRVEENQRLAYIRYKKCGNKNFNLAIIWNNDVYIIPFDTIDFADKSIDLTERFPIFEDFYKE